MHIFELPEERGGLIQALRHRGRTEYGLRGSIYSVAAAALERSEHPEVDFRVAALLNTLGSLPDKNVLQELHDLTQQDASFIPVLAARIA
jgi:hypothetical protein